MKILMLTSRYGFGYGMGYSAYKEARAFTDLDHSVTVVHCYNSPEIATFYDPRIKTIYLPIKKTPLLGFFVYYFKLKKFLKDTFRKQSYDVIYIQSLEFGLIDMKKMKIPIFYFARSTMAGLHKTLKDEGAKKSLLNKIVFLVLLSLEKRCMKYVKVIFVKSKIMVCEVRRLYHISASKIVTINGGIDESNFKINNYSLSNALKKKFSLPSSKIILYAGRIVPQKGLIYLIKAALRLLENNDFAVIVVGASPDKHYMKLIDELLENNIHKKSFYFLGHINQMEMSSVYSMADCIVTPSLYEPFGMVNLQAAFLGKAVITTETAGSIDLLQNYQELTVIKPRSIEDIKVSIKKILIMNKKTALKPFNFNQYSWENVSSEMLEYFNSPIDQIPRCKKII